VLVSTDVIVKRELVVGVDQLKHSNARRRLLAALAAMGVGTVTGVRAQEAATGSAEATTPCVEVSYLGNLQNGLSNYAARADSADFAFLAPMTALGDGMTLFSEGLGGAARQSYGTFKGRASRREGGGLKVETLEIQAPFTAYEQDGQFYNIVGMAHEQNAPVGYVLMSGATSIGEIVFEKGVFDPNSAIVGLDTPTALLVSEAMLDGPDFKVALAVGGQFYSEIVPTPGSFRKFFDDVLLPAMDTARRRDAETPCVADAGQYDDLNCFLTSACCAVIGLRDSCWELETLRRFRDGWLSRSAEGRADIARYYREAPAVARRLAGSEGGRRELLALYWRYIVPSAVLTRIGANRAAHLLYRRMMLNLLGPVQA